MMCVVGAEEEFYVTLIQRFIDLKIFQEDGKALKLFENFAIKNSPTVPGT